MKKVFKTISIILSLLIISSLISCSNTSPETSVKNFFDALKKQDMTTATSYLIDGSKDISYDNPQQEKIIKQIFSKLNCEIISTNTEGDKATVKAKVTSPDLVNITSKAISELLPQLMVMAFSNNSDVEDKASELIEEYFTKSLSDPKLSLTTNEIDIKLKKINDKWLIDADDKLGNAITGNIAEALEKFDQAESSDSGN